MRESKHASVFLSACCALLFLWESGRPAWSQGTLVYDQQSATNGIATHGNPIQALQPIGQSFVPAFAFVGFAQFQFADGTSQNGVGAMIYMNLREDSISGNVLASTVPVFFQDGFFGAANFVFPSNVAATPGTTYYLQPVLQSGDSSFVMLSDQYNYAGGTAIFLGQPDPAGKDFWFREGFIVPEPSVLCLTLGGATIAVWLRRERVSASI